MTSNLRPLVADPVVHLQQERVLFLSPRATVQALSKVVGESLSALLVGPAPHHFRNLQVDMHIYMVAQREGR